MHISIFLLKQFAFSLQGVLFIFGWRALFRSILGALFGTMLWTLFWTLFGAFFGYFLSRGGFLFRSISVIKLVSFFFLFLIFLQSHDGSCRGQVLFIEPICFLLSFFETVGRVELIHSYIFFQLKVFQSVDSCYLGHFIVLEVHQSFYKC